MSASDAMSRYWLALSLLQIAQNYLEVILHDIQ
jgi:hypothetical protein